MGETIGIIFRGDNSSASFVGLEGTFAPEACATILAGSLGELPHELVQGRANHKLGLRSLTGEQNERRDHLADRYPN